MGQKTTATGLRLGKRANWSSLWCEDRKQFAKTLFSDLDFRFYNETLLNYLGLFASGTIIKKNAQSLKSFTKVASSGQIVGNWFSYTQKVPECSGLRQKMLSYRQKNRSALLYASFAQNAFEYQKHNFVSDEIAFFIPNQKQAILPLVSSQAVCNYVIGQLATSAKSRDRSFKISLQKGLAKIAAQLSKKTSTIFGIKVIACGRWRKTKKGRSQKVSLIVGGLKAQSSTSAISYGFSTIATKFGACGIKFWICYKPLINTK